MNPVLKQMYRQELKTLGLALRALKNEIRTDQKSGVCAARKQSTLHWERERCRYLHLNYGLLRGRTMESMERNPHIAFDEKKLVKYQLAEPASEVVVLS